MMDAQDNNTTAMNMDDLFLESKATPGLTIRSARQSDVATILSLIRELAEYEKLADQVAATEAQLEKSLFGEAPTAQVILAEFNGEPVAFALFFPNYSTFLARPGLYIEDLYVRPSMRNKGIGKALLAYVARLAVERGCGRLEWSVLDWNTPAINFYEKIGAHPLNDWTMHRLTGSGLLRLAADSSAIWHGL